jgi:hypothetical protein
VSRAAEVSCLAIRMKSVHARAGLAWCPGLRAFRPHVGAALRDEQDKGSASTRRTTKQIGTAGELLVQYRLLELGVDIARPTTDAGIDVVFCSPATGPAMTVQVKTVERAMPPGGTGRHAIGWNLPHHTPAQLLAFHYLEQDLVWLFTAAEARRVAQQRSPKDVRRLYWYTDLTMRQRDGVPLIQSDMDKYLLFARAPVLFPR